MKEYIYILSNKDWQYENKYKFGYTKNPIQRLKNSHEQHSYLSMYFSLYSITKTEQYTLKYTEYDKIIYTDFKFEKYKKRYKYPFNNLLSILKHLVKDGGSLEFIYKEGLEVFEKIILEDFNILGLIATKIDVHDINLEIKEYYDSITEDTIDDDDNSSSSDSDDSEQEEECYENMFKLNEYNIGCDCPQSLPYNIILREYQQELIDKIILYINDKKKCYLELPTGGGKSVIVYNVFNIIKPKIIIIFSPRKIVNLQNVSNKYLNILNDNYKVIHDITKKITENTIIVACIQSCNKIYDNIIKYNICDIFIWFDEAHWSLEGWIIDNADKCKAFFLNDNKHICWRLFTSASPDENIIKEHKQIYGELINDVSVKQLIDDKYLCNINPYIFSTKKDDPDILEYNLKNFQDNHKKYGMSFHNNRDNAYELFIKHYLYFKNNKTTICPFLLISNYNELKLNDIVLNYNYKSIKTFEKTEYSIGYVVAQYSMGYDFNSIDTIFLSDPKLSHKDIIQTIGRGMRPDMLGDEGTNLNKVLHVYLPTYLEDAYDSKNEYSKIIEVLKYFVNHIELTFEDIKFNKKTPKKDKDINDKDAQACDIYKGSEEVKAKLLNIIRTENKALWNTKRIVKHLSMYNIHNSQDYKKYSDKYIHLGLPEFSSLFTEFKDFAWFNTYKDGECPYYNRNDCIKVIKNIDTDEYYDMDDDNDKIEYLNKYDNRIPNTNLWRFYGGNRGDYF